MSKRHEYEFIKQQIEKESYILLSKEYKNASYPLRVLCTNRHETSITYGAFKAGKRCKFCSHNAPVAYDIVNKEFNKRGYVLLSKEYINSSKKLDYICPNGHTDSISWNSFQQGHGCPNCYGNDKLTIDFVRKAFADKGAVLISTEYINNKEKLDYVCSEGHKHSIAWDSWSSGHGCPDCSGNAKNDFESIKLEFGKKGYEVLTEDYINNKQKLKYKCPEGHVHYMSYGKFKYGRECPTCAVIRNTGPGNHAWKGGISYEPYCPIWKDKEYKEDIKKRDDFKCLNPYCNSKRSNDLVIHHVDYDKKNCSPKNLITVCRSCNNKANKDRKWHVAWYQALLKNRGVV